MKKVSFYTLGCKLNRCETDSLRKGFIDRDYNPVGFGEKSDVVVINTCLVTRQSEIKCKKIIRKAVRENPRSTVAVVGCFAELKPEEIESIKGVNIVLGTHDKYKIFDHLKDGFSGKEENYEKYLWMEHLGYQTDRTRAFLKIQDGCSFFCSYCIIPFARGESISRDKQSILKQVNELVSAGYKEIVITGINIGDYNGGLTDLLKSIMELKGEKRIRLSSIEPDFITDELIEYIRDTPGICKHFHIPLQSGDDIILKKMNRHYNSEFYRKIVEKIKKAIPFAGIGTDVIAGFPGESKEHFNNTYSLIRELPFSYVHVFPFSVRDGTESCSMTDDVTIEEKKDRCGKLIRLSRIKKKEFLQKNTGRTEEVLFEKIRDGNFIKGFTSNYIRVKVDSGKRESDNIINNIFNVELQRIENFEIVGKIIV